MSEITEEPKPFGRPTKYKPEYCAEIIRYFNREPYQIEGTGKNEQGEDVGGKRVANDLPFFSGFATKIGVCVDTLIEWTKVYPDFSEAYKKAKEMQEQIWATNSLYGLYNPAFTIFLGKNVFKWQDKQVHAYEGGLSLRTNLSDAENEALQNAADIFAKSITE